MPLREQLQATLGAAYTLDRELGGGGMSRVFVARDEALRRNIVVKVLPPELLAGVNAERFDREIQLAAGLQHPHIVQVLTAGQMDGIPYYTMPFVDGESLRLRLTRAGRLPITEVIGYLRDVAKALAYAHERGVVHRDIKPDNVLISGGSATVTDFGIAKALSASRTAAPGGTLTQIGTSIGTPTYMSPEQAAGDPATDARTDIYSFGCLAYELLAGRPPFTGKTPQKLLAAHMAETPVPVTGLRPDTPAELAELVARCLAKDADDRPQSAVDLVRVLEGVTSGGGHAAMPAILLGGRGMLKKALAAYAVAFIAVAIVARAAIVAIGLPDWVFPGALVVMALGLPVILFTAYVHHETRRAVTETPTYTPGGTPSMVQGTMATIALKASPHVSWRRTAIGGAWAVGAFIVLIGGYMVLRASGVGPFGSLMASGALGKDEKLLVADFPSPAGDSTLGPVVTEAFRTALAQSQSVQVLQLAAMHDVLRRMQRADTTPVDFGLAREIATREGIRAVLDGTLLGVGGRYAISLRLMSPTSGEALATFRETASSEAEILPTVDKLAKQVRSKIGESLRNVQQTPPLEQVTTGSLEALKKYVQASRSMAMDGDFAKGSALMEQAIALDTSFAMAYRKLAVESSNRGLLARAKLLLDKAYTHRDRLSDAERLLVTGSYFQNGGHQDIGKAQVAYEQLLELQPGNSAALNNLGNIYAFHANFPKAADLHRRAIAAGPPSASHYTNLAQEEVALGHTDSALMVLDAGQKAFPTNPSILGVRADIYVANGQLDSAGALLARLKSATADPVITGLVADRLQALARMRGKLGEARQYLAVSAAARAKAGDNEGTAMAGWAVAFDRAWFLGDKAGAQRLIADSLAHHPVDSVLGNPQNVYAVVLTYSIAGQPDKARSVLARWDEVRKRASNILDEAIHAAVEGYIAQASGQYADAARLFQAADTSACSMCELSAAGQAYDLEGKPDSAIMMFNKYLDTPDVMHQATDQFFLAGTYKRLGELYEAKGNRDKALENYRRFVELWKNADAELQPKVAEVRAKIARLGAGKG
jgi:tetratricopeptide (TPR) repeat protein